MKGRELFVYYRVAPADAPRCEAAIRACQARLMQDEPRLRAGLLARPEATDGVETWMETYAADGGVDPALQARIEAEALRLAPLVQGPRHLEVFIRRT